MSICERTGGDELLRRGCAIRSRGKVRVHHARVANRAGADGIHADAILGVTESETLRQPDEREFADRINGVVCSREQSGVTGRVDDAAASGRDQVRDCEFGSEERGLEVRVEALVPVLFRDFVNLFDHADAGVVDKHVEPTANCGGTVDQTLQLVNSSDIAGRGMDAETGQFGPRCLGQSVVTDKHAGTVLSEQEGGGSADAAGSTGNDGDSAREDRGGRQRIPQIRVLSFQDIHILSPKIEVDLEPQDIHAAKRQP